MVVLAVIVMIDECTDEQLFAVRITEFEGWWSNGGRNTGEFTDRSFLVE